MKTNNLLTIVIPAYNEYTNLLRLIPEILSQHHKNYRLKEILIVSDGSTDQTNKLKINSRKVKITLLLGRVQKGKPARVNQALKIVKTPLLVLLDADTKFAHSSVLDNLVSPLVYRGVDYTSGIALALPPTNFVSNVAAVGVKIWSIARSYLPPHCLYNSEGMLRAFSQQFYKNLTFPKVASIEDTYPYLFAVKNHYTFNFVKTAKVYYQLPTTFADYHSQQRRYHASDKFENTIFSDDLVKDSRLMTNNLKLKALLTVLSQSPIYTLIYFAFSLYLRLDLLLFPFKVSQTWEVLNSTKNL